MDSFFEALSAISSEYSRPLTRIFNLGVLGYKMLNQVAVLGVNLFGELELSIVVWIFLSSVLIFVISIIFI